LGAAVLLLSASLVFIFKFVITDRLTAITDHFLDLQKQSKKLKIRNIEIKGQDEIAILAKSFNKLVTKLNKKYIELTLENERREQVQKALFDSEEKYRKLFEMESDALVLFDFETLKMLDVNNALVELYGYSREKILCMKITDLSAEADKTLDSIQKGEKYIRNRYHKKKNGEVFPVEITTNLYEYKGRNVYLAAIRDITNRKTIEQQIEASLKEKEILLSEIHHRVKNNFEIISSLLDMASMGSENKEVKNLLLSSRTRIHSMAMIHSQLYQSDWFDRVEMVKHIKELSENLKFLYKNEKKIKIEIKPSEVYLSLKLAIPCALIINELITNSLKYAFVGKKHGKIHVSMNDSNDNKMLLRVKDDGVGFGENEGVKPAGSLGLELVNHLVLGQLKGEISIHHNDGTDICIEFKRQ
jgi:PAS domain S-box-containing protein